MPSRRFVFSLSLLAMVCLQSALPAQQSRLRRPIALAVSGDESWLYVANRNSGSISVIHTQSAAVAKEIEVGGRLSGLASSGDSHLLALDADNHQLVSLAGIGIDCRIASRLDVASYPTCLMVDSDRQRCYITSLWTRSVTLVDLSHLDGRLKPQLRVIKELQLPFEPRELCLAMNGTRLIVAGSFGNGLAVIDTGDLELIATRHVPGHNIRGLATSRDGKSLWVAQQELNPLARSSRDDVHWGNMVSNLLVSYSLDDLCDVQADVLDHRIAIQLGEPGNAAGDPGAILVGPTGELAIVISGSNELMVARPDRPIRFQRVTVGRRPVSSLATHDGIIYVADMFSDSISVVDLAAEKQIGRISLGRQPELSPAELGEMLFFDSRLSHDGWMSCHSCHTNGHSNGQLNDNSSDGSFGAPKRVLSLLGVGDTAPWAWNGQVKTLADQVRNSIQDTMQGAPPSEKKVSALVAFLETLSPPPPLMRPKGRSTSEQVSRGEQLFKSLNCQHCHASGIFTSKGSFDVGIKDLAGNSRFNPPSLRAVGRQTAFFHDGRARSLRDVFARHKHQLERELSNAELETLLHFLQTL